MSNAVNNVNIEDSARVLSRNAGGDRDHTYAVFSAANAALTGRPTLFFRVHKDSSAGSITLEVKLNNVVVFTSPFGADILRTVHEIVDNGVLQLANNTLTITATAGTGTIEVSDVLLYYPTTV